jgi:hypothetical protein
MDFVISWTKQPNQDPHYDRRGWKKDKPRKYTDYQEQKILSIYYNLKDDPSSFFCGASAILNRVRIVNFNRKVHHISLQKCTTISKKN